MKIVTVDPSDFTATASEILRAAWKPPCIDYSPEYLRWQFGFPSDVPAVALAAYESENPIGFVAATGRRTNAGPIYMSSFMSTIPGTPSAVAIAIVRHQQRELKRSGLPTVVFAQKGSVGEQLLAVGATVGLKWNSLGEYRVHAAMPRARPVHLDVFPVSAGEWADIANSFSDAAALSLSFEPATLEHLETDPFRREFLVCRKNNGPCAVAMLSETPTVTGRGVERTPTLHYVRIRAEERDALGALLSYASGRGPVVNVPNVSQLHPELRKAAGLRATPSVFTAYASTGSTPLPYSGTEFEIV